MTEQQLFVDRLVREAMDHYGFRNRIELQRLVERLANEVFELRAKQTQQGEDK